MLGSRRRAALRLEASPYKFSVDSPNHSGKSRSESPRARWSFSFNSGVRSESLRARLRSCFDLLTGLCVDSCRVEFCDEGRT